MAERKADPWGPIPILGLIPKVKILLGALYANTVGLRRRPVRRRCMAPVGGITTRYAKAKNAAGPIGGAQNLSLEACR